MHVIFFTLSFYIYVRNIVNQTGQIAAMPSRRVQGILPGAAKPAAFGKLLPPGPGYIRRTPFSAAGTADDRTAMTGGQHKTKNQENFYESERNRSGIQPFP